jgi:RNA polymerase sigma factor FliA
MEMACQDVTAYSTPAVLSAEERERLILDHLPQVRWIASRIHEKLPDGVYLEDLISTGIIGLIAAVDNFEPKFNVKLATYAEYKIRGAILDSIRGLDGVPEHKRKRIKMVESAINALEQRFHRPATEDEIAAELNLSLREYQEWLKELRGLSIGSLDAPANNSTGSSLINFIPDTTEDLPGHQVERAELESLLANAISRMPAVERTVLNLYYTEEQNLREIAQVLNLHITRISQLKSQAILRLRAQLQKCWPSTRGIY